MQRSFTRSAIAVAGLTFALGFTAPSVALAETNGTEESNADLDSKQSQDDGLVNEQDQSDGLDTDVAHDGDGSLGINQKDDDPSDEAIASGEFVDGCGTIENQDPRTEDLSSDIQGGTPSDGNQSSGGGSITFIDSLSKVEYLTLSGSELGTSSASNSQGQNALIMGAASDSKTTVETSSEPVPEKWIIAEGTYEISSALRLLSVLDVAGGSSNNSANVQLYQANGTNAQKWKITRVSTNIKDDGYYFITHLGTGMVLDVAGAGKVNGTNVQQYQLNKTYAQQWMFVKTGNNQYKIVSRLSPNLVLDISGGRSVNGTNAQIYSWNGTNAQKFSLYQPVASGKSTVDIADGAYTIHSSDHTSFSLDVPGGQRDAGTNIQLYTANNTQAQKFYIQRKGDYYVISVVGSGKVLSLQSSSSVPGNNVVQANYTGFAIQQWALQGSKTKLQIVNRATGLTLDVSGASFKNGSNVQGYTKNNTAAQNFRLDKPSSSILTSGIYTLNSFNNFNSVLDIDRAASSGTANAQLYASNGSLSQRYGIVDLGNDIYRIRTASSGGWLTYTSSGNVVQLGSGSTPATNANKWRLVWNGSYYSFESLASPGKVLDAAGASTANGTNIQVYKTNGTDAQHFYFTPTNLIVSLTGCSVRITSKVGTSLNVSGSNANSYALVNGSSQMFTIKATSSTSNTYTITSVSTDKVVTANGTGNSANVVLSAASSGNRYQQWYATIADGGYVNFVNVASGSTSGGKALDISGASAANGANVQIYSQNNTDAQKWRIAHYGWDVSGSTYTYYDANEAKSTWNQSAFESWKKVQSLTSKTQYLAAVDQDRCYVTIFFWQNNQWVPYDNWICSVGSKGSPTPNGKYEIKGHAKYVLHQEKYGVWYWSHFGPNWQAFHSVLTYPDSLTVRYSGLGKHNSGGCVRNPMEKAKWMYSNLKIGTTVLVY